MTSNQLAFNELWPEKCLRNVTENSSVDKFKQPPTIKNVLRQYPLTELSKRKMALRVREESERKSEQIKKLNETIAHGAEVIKVHLTLSYIYYGQSEDGLSGDMTLHFLQQPLFLPHCSI